MINQKNEGKAEMSPGDNCSLSSNTGQDTGASTDLRHKVISAIRNHDLEAVCTLLDQGVDVNARDQNDPLLHYAVRAGQSDIVEVLLGQGADPNAPDNKGYCPLWPAVRNGHAEIVQLLLQGGASLYHSGYFDRPLLLSWAIDSGCQMTATLLANGVEPNDPKGMIFPLSIAVRLGRSKVVKLLLDNGAKPNACDSEGFKVLHQELKGKLGDVHSSKEVDIVTILLANHFDPFGHRSALPNNGNNHHKPDLSLLHLAEKHRHTKVANILRNYTLVPYQPASLQCWARASIRSRLVQNQANLAQTLSADSSCLPLHPDLKAFVFQPLSF
nr:ankyrin repeat domain-containing protein [Endozoicomonas sp. ONNA2]